MLNVLAALFVAFAAPAGPDACCSRGVDGDPVRALEAWLHAYRRGQLDLVDLDRFKGKVQRAKDFVSIKYGVVGTDRLQSLNHEKELRLICDALVAQGDEAAVDVLLEVAAIGLDRAKYPLERVPGLVRGIGDDALCRVQAAAARARVRGVASDPGPLRSLAALRALGAYREEADRAPLEAALEHQDPDVRISAAIGLQRAGLVTSVDAIADRIARESNDRALGACFDALVAITGSITDAEEQQRRLRRATSSAIRVLGAHGWQVDRAALGFLRLVRSADTVPALIEVLQRYVDAVDGSEPESVSGLVRRDAHELLLSLTGATFPMSRPDQWRQWWESARDEFQVVARKEVAASQEGEARTTTGTFFGIPVRGSRVLFVADFSGSMTFMSDERVSATGQRAIKIDIARRELKGAISKLTASDEFNLVWFNTKTGAWKPKLVPATDSNKKKFYDYVDRVEADGGTNLWGGLEKGLDIRAGEKRDRYESWVDEVFVLSDGLPSVGEIIDPAQILAAVRDANMTRRVRINTVFVTGSDDLAKTLQGQPPPFDMEAPELMKRLAQENGGVFIQPGAERSGQSSR